MFEIVFKQEPDLFYEKETENLRISEYSDILYIFDSETSLYDNESNGILQIKKKMLEKDVNHVSNSYSLLNHYFFQVANNPYVKPDVVRELCTKTNLSERQIRDFFRNKRKRFIKSTQDLLDEDINRLNDNDQNLNKIINDYLIELS